MLALHLPHSKVDRYFGERQPLVIAIQAGVSGNQRTGIAAGLIFLVGGLILLNRVKQVA